MTSRKREERREAAKSLGATLRGQARLFSLVTNTLAKDKETEDRWRHYPSPVSGRNRANQIEDEVVGLLGPQRAAARRCRPADPLGRGA